MSEPAALRERLGKDVLGAPVKIGARVRVGKGSDCTFDASFRGANGVVEYLEYSCGCGQSFPHDPMIGVRFPDGRLEEFWAEELHTAGHDNTGVR